MDEYRMELSKTGVGDAHELLFEGDSEDVPGLSITVWVQRSLWESRGSPGAITVTVQLPDQRA